MPTYGDAILVAQLGAEAVHDALCPAHRDGIEWHQCAWRPALLATAEAIDEILANLDHPEDGTYGAALALHDRSCRDDTCGPNERHAHAATFRQAAEALTRHVRDTLEFPT
jgi:hypothetical protein